MIDSCLPLLEHADDRNRYAELLRGSRYPRRLASTGTTGALPIASRWSRNHEDRLDASAEGFFGVTGAAFEGSEEVHEALAQGRWQRRYGWCGILSPNGKVKEGVVEPSVRQ